MGHPMMQRSLKDLEHGDFDNLAQLIEERGLDVLCPHCHTSSVQPLGWLRGRPEMECAGCHELIILDTAELRETIRRTTRQLRDLSGQLHAQVPSWK